VERLSLCSLEPLDAIDLSVQQVAERMRNGPSAFQSLQATKPPRHSSGRIFVPITSHQSAPNKYWILHYQQHNQALKTIKNSNQQNYNHHHAV
jgi:hypothetical protein